MTSLLDNNRFESCSKQPQAALGVRTPSRIKASGSRLRQPAFHRRIARGAEGKCVLRLGALTACIRHDGGRSGIRLK
jgi:hypothetical protein